MRIGLLTSVGETIDAFFPEMIDAWREGGHRVVPAAGSPARRVDSEVLPGLTRRPSIGLAGVGPALRGWVARERLQVVLTNTATASAAVRLAKVGAPVVYFCHGLHWADDRDLGGKPWQWTERALLGRTAGVITINSDDEEWFRRTLPHGPVLRLAGGVGLDTARFAPAPVPTGTRRILWIGELAARKRPVGALDVADELVAMGVDFHLDMLGEGPMRAQLGNRIRATGLSGHVSLLGQSDVAAELPSAAAVLHTAAWEGLPRALLEAVAVGRPVVAYDAKGVRDVPGVATVDHLNPRGAARLLAESLTCPRSQECDVDLSVQKASSEILRFLGDVAG